MTGGSPAGGNEGERRQLPKRFYTTASVPPQHPFRVLLDGQPMRTPAKKEFVVPTRAFAEAIATEWADQGEYIDPARMPLTRLANTAIDGVSGRESGVRAEIVKYAAGDVLCYRADGPTPLVLKQEKAWDPILAWARSTLGARLETATGIMPVVQSDGDVAAIARCIDGYDAFSLAPLHVMSTLMGSVVLALAHARGHLSAEAAWDAAHVDEDWQIARWGEDAEANARRVRRWAEMQAASRMLQLVGNA